MKRIRLLIACMCLFLFQGCTNCENNAFGDAGYTIDEVNLEVGLTKPVRLIVINDLHLQINNDEIAAEQKEFMTNRVSEFTTNGLSTEKRWKKLPKLINDVDADYVLFAGDILDYNSKANAEALKAGLDKLNKPYMYVRADHDMECYWQATVSPQDAEVRQAAICDNDYLLVKDLGEIIIMGVNFTQNNITDGTLERINEVMAMGKPVVVLTHIPIGQWQGTELQNYSESVRDGRRLYWAPGADKEPNAATAEYINLIYAEDSPVVAVLAGHLHAKWEGQVSPNAIEHIFAPCFMNNVGIVNIE